MKTVIGYTRRELVDLMLDYGIHTSIGKFEMLACLLQQKVIDASGAPVVIHALPDEISTSDALLGEA